MQACPKPIIKWLIGPVREDGYEALRISLENFWLLYADQVEYVVCFNRIDCLTLQQMVAAPALIPIQWYDQTPDRSSAAGEFGWKFYPLKLTADRRELWLDNDLVIHKRHPNIDSFLFGKEDRFLFLEDVQRVYQPESLDAVIPIGVEICGGLVGLPARSITEIREEYVRFLRRHAIPETDTHFTAEELKLLGIENASVAVLYLCFPGQSLMISKEEIPPGKFIRSGILGHYGMHFTGLNRGPKQGVAWSFRRLADSSERPRCPAKLPPEMSE